MNDFELPDIGLIPCAVELPGLGACCSGLQLVGVNYGPEMILTVRCGLGHEATGTLLGLFSWWDLATPALFFLDADDFRELELHVADYRMFVTMAAANGRELDTSRHDQQLRDWASKHTIVPFEVWLVAREHWDVFDKPGHLNISADWVPDEFKPEEWA